MIKENLKLVIKKFYESAISDLMERQPLFDFSILHAPFNTVITIVGLRQAGKTFFSNYKGTIEKRPGITDILYINFEDERILPIGRQDFQSIPDACFKSYEKKTKPFIFLDEFQNVNVWDRFVRRLNDKDIPLFITGLNFHSSFRQQGKRVVIRGQIREEHHG